MSASAALQEALLDVFGHHHFRTGQQQAAEAVLEGRDVVAVMPTGAGKSICYQLPAALLQGTTLVVSPLIALMKDQVDALRSRSFPAAAIHSGLSGSQRFAAENAFRNGQLRILYVAPERLRSDRFRSLLRTVNIARLVVDEAHCISQWGHDFRPDYRRIGGLREELGVPAAAFTATATPDVRTDICQQLNLRSPLQLVTGFDRPNLTLAIEECSSRVAKAQALDRVVREVGPPGIVYAATRKDVEMWAALLRERGLAADSYHAGRDDADRHHAQDEFLAGRLEAIAATNAFGMGIDKADIRFVIHADLPGSVEAYYQEAGRAGRDGLPARCVLLYSPADIRTQEFFLSGSNPPASLFREAWHLLGQGADDGEIEASAPKAANRMALGTALRLLRQAAETQSCPLGEGPVPVDLARVAEKARRDGDRLRAMVRYAHSRTCRTRFIFDYFAGDALEEPPECGTCDVCQGWRFAEGRELSDREVLTVRIALSAVARLSGRFGAARIAQVLIGSQSQEVTSRGLHRLPTHGKLRSMRLEDVKELLAALLDGGYVERQPIPNARPGTFVLGLTPEGRDVMKAEAAPRLAWPKSQSSTSGPESAPPLKAPRSGSPTARTGPRGAPEDIPLDGEGEDLYSRLKTWRLELAREDKIPPFYIFADKTLKAIASQRPSTAQELLGVKGIGPAKLEKYGKAVLGVLKESPNAET